MPIGPLHKKRQKVNGSWNERFRDGGNESSARTKGLSPSDLCVTAQKRNREENSEKFKIKLFSLFHIRIYVHAIQQQLSSLENTISVLSFLSHQHNNRHSQLIWFSKHPHNSIIIIIIKEKNTCCQGIKHSQSYHNIIVLYRFSVNEGG